ncbi:hypothetical protein AK812_SmicGene41267 [Symbiodinium microadriaticum]|uniref:Uncharacterized protein n=1 Tax=Symbiodinium microadriaticum TaxID=2951 RepID=A0A1Q9C6M3_SYMMI|nr:hypothetical protein AK812_SmicGene41267 [Symbiodinium microadriaticum]
MEEDTEGDAEEYTEGDTEDVMGEGRGGDTVGDKTGRLRLPTWSSAESIRRRGTEGKRDGRDGTEGMGWEEEEDGTEGTGRKGRGGGGTVWLGGRRRYEEMGRRGWDGGDGAERPQSDSPNPEPA